MAAEHKKRALQYDGITVKPALTVQTPSAKYPVYVGRNLFPELARTVQKSAASRAFVVTSPEIWALWGQKLLAAFSASAQPTVLFLPAGERFKRLAQVEKLADQLARAGADRSSILVAFGGGIVGDLSGFLAAIYMRGIDYIQAPTTLLAQVDSSVGGKTGVNHAGGKNLIGAFYQPRVVIADTDTLATLPERELRAGIAEVIKYGCVWDPLLFEWLDHHMPKLVERDAGALAYAIARSCEIKATVVSKDEREQNLRAILNFGHTFGHAIEAATGYGTYLHGEAVALGMLIASDLARRIGLTDAAVRNRIADILKRAGLPTAPPRLGAARILELMHMDKKVLGGKLRLVLLEKIGHAIVTADYAQSDLEATLGEYFG
jgi:3-dehydroquinate synthase